MIGVELVKSDGTPAPTAPSQLVQGCFQKGLLLLRCGESAIRLCPPLVITQEQAETALCIIEDALSEIEKQRKRERSEPVRRAAPTGLAVGVAAPRLKPWATVDASARA